MSSPRTPAPSRIGKTLGAILSTPRRGTSDADAVDDVAEAVPQLEGAAGGAPVPDPGARPTTSAATAADGVTPERGAGDPTPDARATPVEPPPPVVPAAASVGAAPALPVDEVELVEAIDGGGGARRKKRETFLIPEDLADAMRNAIVHLSGPPLYYTLAEFGEHAIRSYMAHLEREHNAGRPFPPRPRAVRQGRPLR